jgi:predicted transposase/invertase (TIGR01784 family)
MGFAVQSKNIPRQSSPVRTDTLFYRLFTERPQLVFELAGLETPDAGVYTLRAEEIKETAFRLDGVLLPPDGRGDLPPVFLEVQFQDDEAFYARWFAEIFLYLYRRRITGTWRAVAMFARKSVDTGETTPYQDLLDSPRIQRVYLREDLPDIDGASPGVGLVHLVLSRTEDAPRQAQRLVTRATPEERAWVLELAEAILAYKLPDMTLEDIKMILDLQHADLEKSRFYQQVLAEGREEGREEGRQIEAAAMVLRLVRHRFGVLAPDLEARVAALALDRLEALAEALLDFQTKDALESWLHR